MYIYIMCVNVYMYTDIHIHIRYHWWYRENVPAIQHAVPDSDKFCGTASIEPPYDFSVLISVQPEMLRL